MAESTSQRRDLVRVDDTLEISHRPATEAEIENLGEDVVPRESKKMGLTSLSSFSDSAGGNIDANSPSWQALLLLDKKLDYIISLLDQKKPSAAAPTEAPFHRAEINISGSGVRFPSRTKYKDEEVIIFVMILPMMPPVQVECVAAVVRTRPLHSKHSFSPGVDVSSRFRQISESDIEEILRFAFQRQREQLRARREPEE